MHAMVYRKTPRKQHGLLTAVANNDVDALLELKEKGKPINNATLGHALRIASEVGSLELIPLIFSDIKKLKAATKTTDEQGKTALHIASEKGHENFADFLIEAGANVNVADKLGHTPLHAAAKEGRANIIRLLLRHKADPEQVDEKGETPLYHAVVYNRINAVHALGEKSDVNRHFEHQTNPFGPVRDKYDLKILENLGFPKLEQSEQGNTLLHVATLRGDSEMATALMHHGADPTERNGYGVTPIHLAAYRGDFSTLKQLVGKSTNRIKIKDNAGFTPLHYAAKARLDDANEHTELMDWLISQGANVSAESHKKITPLHLAADRYDAEKAMGLLLEKGARIDAQDHEGNTPLHYAAQGRRKNFDYLVSRGAGTTIRNQKGHLPAYDRMV
ncbi:ankyrin repeat domain-containing protein [Candidatus Micrarchaeota archaeon]|nr:ankyrin repeat domain-containing protein [Candidatus Micrarchaeota archaeon]